MSAPNNNNNRRVSKRGQNASSSKGVVKKQDLPKAPSPPPPPQEPKNLNCCDLMECELECPICFINLIYASRLSTGIKSTVCGHIFCSECINKLLKDTIPQCPLCRRRIFKGVPRKIIL